MEIHEVNKRQQEWTTPRIKTLRLLYILASASIKKPLTIVNPLVFLSTQQMEDSEERPGSITCSLPQRTPGLAEETRPIK